ncbi:polysaccharide biosynthesis/export family protein [Paraburkholderia xenovorans LB400]|jgi:polysaccharide biosynthesis/export protein|uniref:Polysaccharide export protein n=1 Tax=Paraburkholderia xenovorans (strain LB400) TaxID=266265 RepID=Q144V6_PARXL|nr:polysaccharide biosynthesis/export family protein [Paraburkholderia xenovorans]ABE29133.1 Putative polysaccharide export protein [Paraburkholderia xenovorans LB400]AIP31456.1 polysaccharide biosynthesis/export family protein [Paraburkholderia xenovorans LB400]EIF28297.1 periplasmic protein involved in polysaccharide export [Burkholderia sp. Ch1-1]
MSSLGLRTGSLLVFATAALLSGCGIAPGQRMVTPAAIQDTGGDYSTEANSQQQIPITDINLALLRKMNQAQTTAPLSPQMLALFGKPTPYKVGPGDVLQIVVWDHPELAAALGQPAQNSKTTDAAPGFLIDENGDVQFPYAGTVHVAGKDVAAIQKELHRRLSTVYQKPEVTVRVASFRAAQVYVDGEVRTPGAQSVNDIPMSLTTAISLSGGLSPNADRSRVVLIRNGVPYQLNMDDLIRRGRNPSDIYLQAGDMLRVASREDSGVYVMGEVNKPATILPMRNGSLTLSQAISDSGSFDSNTAAARQLFVIRNSTSEAPEVYHLDATSPVSMVLANQFELQPKDVVYVGQGGLVRFNRVLNLLLPAINAAVTGAVLAK